MIRLITLFLSLLTAAACQHASEAEELAILANNSTETLSAMENELLNALGKQGWRLDTSEIGSSSITVRPPKPDPLNTNNPALPMKLELIHRAGECFAVRLDTGERIALQSVTCAPAPA